MKKILAATAALALMTASGGAFAQVNCNNANNHGATPQTQAQGSGAAAGDNPVGTTCEKVEAPSGKTYLQNGPAVNDAGGATAPHEGTGAGAK